MVSQREGITVVIVSHKMADDEEECSFIISGIPDGRRLSLAKTLRHVPGFINVHNRDGEIDVGLDCFAIEEGEEDDYYDSAYSQIVASIRAVLGGDVKIRRRRKDGDGGRSMGELIFGEAWKEKGAFTEEERRTLA